MVKEKKLTEKDFKLFVKECEKWIDILGLKSYGWEFCFGQADEDVKAQFSIHSEARGVKIYLNDKWLAEDYSEEAIKRTAFHEVFETLLVELKWMARSTYSSEAVETEAHKVVRTMENVLFSKY